LPQGEVERPAQRRKLTVDSGGRVSSRKSRCLVTLDAVGGEINRAIFAERLTEGPDAPFEGRKRSAAVVAVVEFEAFQKFPDGESKIWSIPGVRRHQTGDSEIRAVFPVEALEQVATVIRAKRWGGTGRGCSENFRSKPGQMTTSQP